MNGGLWEVTKNYSYLRVLRSVGICLALAVILAFSFLTNITKASSGPGIAFRSATSANNTISTTLLLPVPAGVSAGDVLLASIDVENSPTITMPGGWTLIRSDTSPTALHLKQSDYFHVATTSEPANYTWTFSVAHGASGGIIAYSGVDGSNPIDAVSSIVPTSSSQIAVPSLTTSQAGDMLIDATSINVNRILTVPAGMAQRYANQTTTAGEKAQIVAADQLIANAGPTGSRTVTADSGYITIGHLIALRPSPAVDTTAPSTPAGITQTSSTVSSITVSWGPSLDNVGVTGYTVYQNGVAVSTTTSTSYNFTGLACGSTYPLAVDAFDGAGNHSTQATINGSTIACPDVTPPSVPTSLTQQSNTDMAITVGWNASTDNVGVTGYTLYQNGVAITSTTSNSYTFLGLACANSYALAVDAFDAAGNHSSQTALNGTTANCPDTTAPSTPTGLNQTGSTSSSIAFNWTSSTDTIGVSGYTVYLNGAVVGTTSVTDFNLGSLACGTAYNLSVDAFDAAGNHSTQVSLGATTANCVNVLPTVTITAPASGTTVSGNLVSVTASASGSSGIANVQFLLDGTLLGNPVFISPYTVGWDTTTAGDGPHTLTAIVTDNNNNSATTSTSVTVTVANSPPVVDLVTINQASPMTNDMLSATVSAHDPAGQSLSYSYQWIKNGAVIAGANGPTLDLSQSGNGNKADTISLQVTVNNGTFTSQPLTSSPITIINSPPSATVSLSSTTPDTDVTITATATLSDQDGDLVSLTYVWSVNGTAVKTTVTSSLSDSLDLSLAGNGNYGDSLKVQVTPNDGTLNGITVQASGTVTKPATGTVLEYALGGTSLPSGITSGPDGNLWFSLESASSVGRIAPNGTITLFALPQTGNLGGINPGPDGNIWFSEFTNNKISKINPTTFVITRYSLPANSGVGGIVAGSDGNMWFLESSANKIGSITMSGVITLFTIPTASSFPHGPNLGPDGNIWFNEMNASKIGKITPSGVITEYKIPTATAKPDVIVAGPDGNLWFTELVGKIGRITTSGVITEFTLPSGSAQPVGISSGPDGNLWFAERSGNKIGRITTSGVITEFLVPTAASQPDKIVSGPDGNLWFTELSGKKIGRITP